jgi:hypothetical protein
MTKLADRATIGDDNAAEVLRLAGIAALKKRAAQIPPDGKNIVHTLADLSDEDIRGLTIPEWQIEELHLSTAGIFDSYYQVETLCAELRIKPFIPLMPLAQMDNSLCEILKWLNGRGWIAGSAALWAASGDKTWSYADVDIFCHSNEAYDELTEELCESEDTGGDYEEYGERSRVFLFHPFETEQPLHLVSPLQDDWSDIANLLLGFDNSICATAIANQSEAYAFSPHDIRNRLVDVVKIKHRRAFLERLLRYMKRGYTVKNVAFDKMVEHGGFQEDFELLWHAASFADNTQLRHFVSEFEAANEYEDYDADDWDWHEDEHYNDYEDDEDGDFY